MFGAGVARAGAGARAVASVAGSRVVGASASAPSGNPRSSAAARGMDSAVAPGAMDTVVDTRVAGGPSSEWAPLQGRHLPDEQAGPPPKFLKPSSKGPPHGLPVRAETEAPNTGNGAQAKGVGQGKGGDGGKGKAGATEKEVDKGKGKKGGKEKVKKDMGKPQDADSNKPSQKGGKAVRGAGGQHGQQQRPPLTPRLPPTEVMQAQFERERQQREKNECRRAAQVASRQTVPPKSPRCEQPAQALGPPSAPLPRRPSSSLPEKPPPV